MTEASWGDDAMSPSIDWRMSAALENVPRGDSELAEVTSLADAVRAWQELDAPHRADAVLTLEHAILVDGASVSSFSGETIASLVERLASYEAGK